MNGGKESGPHTPIKKEKLIAKLGRVGLAGGGDPRVREGMGAPAPGGWQPGSCRWGPSLEGLSAGLSGPLHVISGKSRIRREV